MVAGLREEFITLLNDHVPGLQIHGSQATGQVPWREDNRPSFLADLEKAVWYDQVRKEGGGVKEFKARLGLNDAEQLQMKWTIVATYDYRDETNNLLYQVVRYEPKAFAQRRPDGKGGWLYNLKDTRRVLYRLPKILSQPIVYVTEGEKDSDCLWSLGIPATTNPQGAGKWCEEYTESLREKQVVILPDNDQVGEQHAQQVARSLLGVAKAVKIVRLPGLPPKGDVSDWLDVGHTREALAEIVHATPLLKPEDLAVEQKPEEKPPEGKDTRRVTLRHPSELKAQPISWYIDTVVPAGMLTVLHARDKVGKTLLAWEVARAVLQKSLFLGTFTTNPGRVVLALLDDPHDLTVQRRDALGLHDCEHLRIVTPLDADLSDPVAFLNDFRKACEEFKPSLIVLDALFHFAPPGRDSMNDAARMRGIMAEFNTLAETLPAAVVLIAHDKKDDISSLTREQIRM